MDKKSYVLGGFPKKPTHCTQVQLQPSTYGTQNICCNFTCVCVKSFVFNFTNRVLEDVKEFKHLGLLFSRSGSFFNAKFWR